MDAAPQQIIAPPPSLDMAAFSPSPVASSSSSGGAKRPAENGTASAKRPCPAAAAAKTKRTMPRGFLTTSTSSDEDDDYDDEDDEEDDEDDEDDEEEHVKTDDEDGDYEDDDDDECASDDDDVDDGAAPARSEKKPAVVVAAAAPAAAIPVVPRGIMQTRLFGAAVARFFQHRKKAARGLCAMVDEYELKYSAGDESSRAGSPFAVFMVRVHELPTDPLCIKITGNGSTTNMAVYAGADNGGRLENYGYVYDDATWDMHAKFSLSSQLVLLLLLRCVLTDEGLLDRGRLAALCGGDDADGGSTLALLQLVVESTEEERNKKAQDKK